MPDITWAPNPYAIAQRLIGEAIPDSGNADDFLRKAFRLDGQSRKMIDVFKPVFDLTRMIDKPMPLAQVMDLDKVKSAGFTQEQLRRVLPLLVPIADARFASPSEAGPADLPSDLVVAAYGDSQELLFDDATYLDPVQGSVADCYLIASLIALAWTNPDGWEVRLNASGFNRQAEDRSFQWQFHDEAGSPRGQLKVTGHIPLTKDGQVYARSATPTEYWPALVEKAYVVMRRGSAESGEPTPPQYQAINHGFPQDACHSLVGGVKKTKLLKFEEGQKIFLAGGLLHSSSGVMKHPVMAWTEDKDDIVFTEDREVWEKTSLFPNHAYAVLGTMGSDPIEHVVLRNPWGKKTAVHEGFATDESWKPDGRAPVPLNEDGVFALSLELFYKYFGNIAWVEALPRT